MDDTAGLTPPPPPPVGTPSAQPSAPSATKAVNLNTTPGRKNRSRLIVGGLITLLLLAILSVIFSKFLSARLLPPDGTPEVKVGETVTFQIKPRIETVVYLCSSKGQNCQELKATYQANKIGITVTIPEYPVGLVLVRFVEKNARTGRLYKQYTQRFVTIVASEEPEPYAPYSPYEPYSQ